MFKKEKYFQKLTIGSPTSTGINVLIPTIQKHPTKHFFCGKYE